MKKTAKNKDVRLLPAVIGVAAILLALKASGIAFDASAATHETPPAAKPPAHAPQSPAAGKTDPTKAINAAMPIPKVDPNAVVDDSSHEPSDVAGASVTPAQMDILTSLADRRDALNDRQRQLEVQSNLLSATEKRIDSKIAELKTLQTKIEGLLDQRDAQDAAQLASLVKIYTAMKPKDAARIFDKLDDQVRLSVAGSLKADIIAGILAQLPADVAQKLTVQLANRYRVTDAGVAGAVAAAATATAPAANVPSTPAPTPTSASAPAAASAPGAGAAKGG